MYMFFNGYKIVLMGLSWDRTEDICNQQNNIYLELVQNLGISKIMINYWGGALNSASIVPLEFPQGAVEL